MEKSRLRKVLQVSWFGRTVLWVIDVSRIGQLLPDQRNIILAMQGVSCIHAVKSRHAAFRGAYNEGLALEGRSGADPHGKLPFLSVFQTD